MHQINPKKLLHSKWTARKPNNKEKHFIISKVEFNEEQLVVACVLEAIMSKKEYSIDWRDLKNQENWLQGWC
ncbi:TIGR02450 family Trp-rich protein [Vibrio fluminensis]|uniref:TIGR02450 family Trp-rich protein n=1 Tax=Vibrio fluminensis TaxID=2783614 RepID=UPI001887A411|nr:TIGR02450 family Trp-rich protein [Vibrio fluminensis]